VLIVVKNNFRSYQVAVQVFHAGKALKLPVYLKDQFLRAASSVVLNLAEGSGKDSPADRRRYYQIAMGSTREVQSILDLVDHVPPSLREQTDHLGACVYKLCRAL
jgi:four helix bundle protein